MKYDTILNIFVSKINHKCLDTFGRDMIQTRKMIRNYYVMYDSLTLNLRPLARFPHVMKSLYHNRLVVGSKWNMITSFLYINNKDSPSM